MPPRRLYRLRDLVTGIAGIVERHAEDAPPPPPTTAPRCCARSWRRMTGSPMPREFTRPTARTRPLLSLTPFKSET